MLVHATIPSQRRERDPRRFVPPNVQAWTPALGEVKSLAVRPSSAPSQADNSGGKMDDLGPPSSRRAARSRGNPVSDTVHRSPSVSAVTTPRAAWTDERTSVHDAISIGSDCPYSAGGPRPAGDHGAAARRVPRGWETSTGAIQVEFSSPPLEKEKKHTFGKPSTQVQYEQHTRAEEMYTFVPSQNSSSVHS